MTGSSLRRAILGVALFLPAVSAGLAQEEPVLSAEVDPPATTVDGTVRLRVTLDGKDLGEVEPPSLAALDDWSVINGPSVTSQFRFVNGVASSRRAFSWVLAPRRAGRLSIPPLSVEVAGRPLTTAALEVPVRAGAAPGAGATPGPQTGEKGEEPGREVFIRTLVEPERPYVGQPVRLVYRLFSRADVAGVPQLQEAPVYPGFLSREIEGPGTIRPQMQRLEGREYRTYDIREVALVPTTAGRVELPPVTFSVPLRASSRSRRSFFFKLQSVEPVYRRTLPITLDVRPLPEEGRPDGFSGAVGRFRLRATADREEARTGEAVALSVVVEGVGNLSSARPPAMEESAEFTLYDPREQSVEPSSGDPFAAARQWEYILVPHLPGEQPLPALRFSAFDPVNGRYRTLVADDLDLSVSGEPLAAGVDGLPEQQALRRLGSDIHFIKPVDGAPAPAPPPPTRTGWFWLLLATPAGANLAAVIWRWRVRRQRVRLPVARRRRARRLAGRRLQRAAAESGRGPEFHRLVAQALTEYVADKFGVADRGLTYDAMAALLARSRVPDGATRDFLEVLEACDRARFAPGQADREPAGSLLDRAGKALDALEERL